VITEAFLLVRSIKYYLGQYNTFYRKPQLFVIELINTLALP